MDQKTALAKLRKVLGNNLGYRIDKNVPVGEEDRAAARQISQQISAKFKEVGDAMDARRKELLDSDELFQKLKADRTALDELRAKAMHAAYTRRITVGTVGSMFFSTKADGDTWAEVVEKVCSKS